MRIRSIKPDFWRSPDITHLDIPERLLFIGLWSYVDDNGVGQDRVATVAADLFADDLERDPRETLARITGGLAKLSEANRIIRYTVENRDFLYIVNWNKHQRIDKPNKPRYPLPTSENAVIREGLAEPSRDSRDIPAPGAGEQGNRGTGEQCVPLPDKPPIDDYVPTEIETSTHTTPTKGSSTELTFIRTHVGQRLPAKVEQGLVNEIRKLRQYDRPVIEEALQRWANRDGHPGLLPHLVGDVLKNNGRTTEPTKTDIWETSVIQPAQAAATEAQRKLS